MIEILLNAGIQGKAADLMAHIFNAQQIWLNRCTQKPMNDLKPWDRIEANNLTDTNDKNFSQWCDYINGLQLSDFERVINYINFSGLSFNDQLIDIVSHVVNHGTHHRAQVGQLLKAAGAELPATDYVHYIRTLKTSITNTQ
ncbi:MULTISPECIES: DinB family protein [unclassified Mucilaginibacter]|uniref:DinB family protein n=1 Tax=unclassified Mucilaginibacter TaxID=2617802 RepID=UPI000A96ADA9|nr:MULTISPECIES: DinB family protein [unclassified Mucilaginibacter]